MNNNEIDTFNIENKEKQKGKRRCEIIKKTTYATTWIKKINQITHEGIKSTSIIDLLELHDKLKSTSIINVFSPISFFHCHIERLN